MPGISSRFTFEDRAARRALGALTASGENLTPLYDEAGSHLVASTQERMHAGRDPRGNPWIKSIRARVEGGQTLIDHANLVQSITHAPDAGGVSVGSNLVYALIHQIGGVIRAKSARGLRFRIAGGGWVRVQSVTIPARPWLGISDEDKIALAAIIKDYWRRATGGGAGAG